MMHIVKLVLMLVLFSNCVVSQTLDAQVFSSSGYFFSNEKSLSSTIGEVVIYDYSQENLDVYQGFQTIALNLNCSFECVLYNHIIDLPQGWSYWSTYLSPKDDQMEDIFSQINEDVIILKDQHGEVYWPYFGINGISSHNEGEGYQIKMNANQPLNIEGYMQINPTVTIYEDWNILGCLYHEPILIEEAMSPIVENIILIKDENANVFWPYLSINTIEYIVPGEGYALKSNSDLNFTFFNQSEEGNRFLIVSNDKELFHYKEPIKTGNNMTIGFSYEILKDFMDYGDEIAVFDNFNNIVGVQIFEQENLALTVWGDDPFTSNKDGMKDFESFSFSIWNKKDQKEFEIEILEWQQGDSFYNNNAINIVGDVRLNKQDFSSVFSVFPNPLISEGKVEFEILDDCFVNIFLVNNLGIRESLLKKELNRGMYDFNFSTEKSPGLYYLIIEKCNNTMSIPLTIIE